MRRFFNWLFEEKTQELYHPESPGMKLWVTRTRLQSFFRPKDFATLSESIKSY